MVIIIKPKSIKNILICPNNNKMLPAISDEQNAIVKCIADHNVIVDSVAGSGKTTTVLYMAKTYPNKQILLLTYNSKLRLETRERTEALDIDNIEVHTYHSFGVNYISEDCKTDNGLIKFINRGDVLDGICYDIVIIDECQDMTPVYYKIVTSILSINPMAKVCVIGDKYQSIYGYAGADSRFITMADLIYTRPCEWRRLSLSVSYRITKQMAAFINRCVLGYDRLTAVRDGAKPYYTIYNAFREKPIEILKEIQALLLKYTPEDIFVLSPSVKSTNIKSPTKKLANYLSDNGIKIYIPTSDDSRLDVDVIRGKLVFSSLHQSKGLERKAVILLGFDESYFKYFNKSDPDHKCSSALYVALTRATEYLSIYHAEEGNPLNFVDLENVALYAELKGCARGTKKEPASKPNKCAVTKLTEHISPVLLAQCMDLFEYKTIRCAEAIIDIPIKICQCDDFGDAYYEEVSDINGIAIPAYYEYQKMKKMSICPKFKGPLTITALLRMANQYAAIQNGLHFKMNQITDYNWISDEMLNASYARAAEELDKNMFIHFEKEVSCKIMGMDIKGRMDVVCDDRIIELKAVGELKPEHYIQLAIYSYMHFVVIGTVMTSHLFNIRTNELIEIVIKPENIERMLQLLVCKKYHTKQKLTKEKFLEKLGFNYEIVENCEECACISNL